MKYYGDQPHLKAFYKQTNNYMIVLPLITAIFATLAIVYCGNTFNKTKDTKTILLEALLILINCYILVKMIGIIVNTLQTI